MGKIYLIKSNNDGFISYKIGKTARNVNKRMDEMKTGNPGKLSLEFEFETPHYNKLESILHRTYQINKIQGEWFSNIDVNQFEKNCNFYNKLISELKNNENPFI